MSNKQKEDSVEALSALPQFNETTLSALTNKIETKLQNPKSVRSGRKSKSEPQESSEKKRPRSAQDPRGQKRDRNGNPVHGTLKGAKVKDDSGKQTELERLRAEIIALGGTDDDLALVAELESGSEVEGTSSQKNNKKGTPKEQDLRNDVAKMLQGMGVEASRSAATTADTDDELVEDVEEELDEEEEEDEAGESDTHGEKSNAFLSGLPEINRRGNSRLSVAPQPDWFAIVLPDIPSNNAREEKIPSHMVDQVLRYAEELLERENQAFQTSQKSESSSSQKFFSQVISSGTLSDKISALTLAVQESPLHNMKGLENLLGLARKRSRAQAIDVLRALKDLFAQGSLLPGDRRLRTFATQPGLLSALSGLTSWSADQPLPRGLRQQHLIVWAYEHWLKEIYFEMMKILESWCNDELEFSKARALSYVYELLKEKPEQESNLLRLLVNKIGDRTKKIASRASYLLLQLEMAHPLMKGTIVAAVEELIWRPGQTLHAKYYAAVTLNQTVLSTKEEEVANKLLDIYFGLFVTLLKPAKSTESRSRGKDKSKNHEGYSSTPQAGKINLQEEDLREKLTSAILTGINRAYPYVTADRERVSEHMDTLFRITHSSNFNTSIQAMLLIQQLTVANQMPSDRFYRTLYESLLDPRLVTSSKQSMYLNLLFKSLKADLNVKRVKAFVKRILQIVSLHQPSFIVGCFHLLKELEGTFPSLKALVDEPEEHDVDEEHFRDVDEDETGSHKADDARADQDRQVFYDSRKRDPEHSNADRSCLWELLPYLAHYHPSVSVGAESVLNHTKLSGKADLNLYTLIHFLDRFVYKNPKAAASATLRGASVMQPTLVTDTSTSLFGISAGQRNLPVNTEKFWKQNVEDVAAEDVFFHQYFANLGKDKMAKKKAKAGVEDEEGDENAIWKAITESRPDLEGADESDEDLDMADLESDFDQSDEEDSSGLEDIDEDMEDESAAGGSEGEGFGGVELVGFDDDDDDDEEEDVSVDGAVDAEADSEVEDAMDEPKKKIKKGETTRERKKRLKSLPTFAAASDYAAMLEDDEGEDFGPV